MLMANIFFKNKASKKYKAALTPTLLPVFASFA
nr:MAG TPA: hypothetical protein [Caudoviricetes sp.]